MDTGFLPHFRRIFTFSTVIICSFCKIVKRYCEKLPIAISILKYYAYSRGLSMKVYQWIYMAAFVILTGALMTLKIFKIGNRRRGVVKMLASVSFLALGVVACVRLHARNYAYLCAIGLFFATLGDLLLVFMDRRVWFIAGTLSFACASAILSVYSILVYGFRWWSLLIFAVLCVLNVICQVKKVYSFGDYVVYLNIYTVLVSLCGSLGLSVAATVGEVGAIVFGVGCFAYLLSDFILGLYLFKFKNRFVDALNTFLYFPGMFLIALSLVFYL